MITNKRVNVSSKEAIIGLRRKNKAREKIGGLIFQMYSENKTELFWVKNICSLLKMDPRVLQKHIGFRIYEQWARQNSILSLDKEDVLTISEVEKIYKRLSLISVDRQKIAHYVFIHLLKNGA